MTRVRRNAGISREILTNLEGPKPVAPNLGSQRRVRYMKKGNAGKR